MQFQSREMLPTLVFTNNQIVYLDDKYWDFTLTTLGLNDIPAMTKYILAKTNKSIYGNYLTLSLTDNFVRPESLSLIGHSQGFTQPIILLSLRPEFEQYLRPFIGLGPVAFISNTRIPVKYLFPIEPIIRLYF